MVLVVMVNPVDLVVVQTIQMVHNLVEIDNHHTVAPPFQIKDILVELVMVLIQVTLDLVAEAVAVALLEKMEAQIQQYLVVDMVVEEKQV